MNHIRVVNDHSWYNKYYYNIFIYLCFFLEMIIHEHSYFLYTLQTFPFDLSLYLYQIMLVIKLIFFSFLSLFHYLCVHWHGVSIYKFSFPNSLPNCHCEQSDKHMSVPWDNDVTSEHKDCQWSAMRHEILSLSTRVFSS